MECKHPTLPYHWHLREPAWQAMVKAAFDASPLETTGLLIGVIQEVAGIQTVDVEACYVLQGRDATTVSQTLPAEAWIAAYWAIETHYPDSQLLGWWHTHPGHGVFLSAADWDLHQRKFAAHAAPWATAWVLDPIQLRVGAFVCAPGELWPVALTGIGAWPDGWQYRIDAGQSGVTAPPGG